MKFLVLLGMVTLVSIASKCPCVDGFVVKESDEEFGVAVHLLNKTLASAKEPPFFKLVKVHSVDVLDYYGYPTLTADLQDKSNEVEERCNVTISKSLDVEDFTTKLQNIQNDLNFANMVGMICKEKVSSIEKLSDNFRS